MGERIEMTTDLKECGDELARGRGGDGGGGGEEVEPREDVIVKDIDKDSR